MPRTKKLVNQFDIRSLQAKTLPSKEMYQAARRWLKMGLDLDLVSKVSRIPLIELKQMNNRLMSKRRRYN